MPAEEQEKMKKNWPGAYEQLSSLGAFDPMTAPVNVMKKIICPDPAAITTVPEATSAADLPMCEESPKSPVTDLKISQRVLISKSCAIPVLKALLQFLTKKISHGNPEQLILICKVGCR